MFSRKVFWGATSPLLPPAIVMSSGVQRGGLDQGCAKLSAPTPRSSRSERLMLSAGTPPALQHQLLQPPTLPLHPCRCFGRRLDRSGSALCWAQSQPFPATVLVLRLREREEAGGDRQRLYCSTPTWAQRNMARLDRLPFRKRASIKGREILTTLYWCGNVTCTAGGQLCKTSAKVQA